MEPPTEENFFDALLPSVVTAAMHTTAITAVTRAFVWARTNVTAGPADSWGMELLGAAALSIVLLVSGSRGPLAQTTASSGPPPIDHTPVVNALGQAQAWGLAEIDLLAELDVFREDGLVTEIYDTYPVPALDEAGLLEALRVVERENLRFLAALDTEGAPLSADARLLLGRLPGGAYDRVTSGDNGFLDAMPYLNGLMDLLLRDGAAPADPRRGSDRQAIVDYIDAMGPSPLERIASDGTTADSTITDPTNARDAAGAGDTAVVDDWSGSDTAVVVAVGAGVVALGVGGTLLLRRRRRAVPSTPPKAPAPPLGDSPALGHVLSTSHRMTKALDVMGVQQIAVTDSLALVGGEAGAFFGRDGAGMRLGAAVHPEFFAAGFLDGGVIARVIETGQPVCLVTSNDPALARVPVAIAAVPVIADAGVIGAVVILRSSAAPYDASALDSLTPIAQVTGSAIVAARVHASEVRRVADEAEIDCLSLVYNRRRLDRDLAELHEQAALGSHRRIGFAMIDVDHFKQFNDANGHGIGDAALRSVASTIAANVRAEDVVYRYGGEEFSVLLRDVDDDEACVVMERVRAAVEQHLVPRAAASPAAGVTVSIGLALAGSDPTSVPGAVPATVSANVSATVARADAALYEAKRAGRNRLVVAPTT
jgi:diguanylate cyclase (GGDEF)-like protein